MEPNQITREQMNRIGAAAMIGFNAAQPLIEFQASMLRILADNVELAAINYGRGLEAFCRPIEQQHRQAAE